MPKYCAPKGAPVNEQDTEGHAKRRLYPAYPI